MSWKGDVRPLLETISTPESLKSVVTWTQSSEEQREGCNIPVLCSKKEKQARIFPPSVNIWIRVEKGTPILK